MATEIPSSATRDLSQKIENQAKALEKNNQLLTDLMNTQVSNNNRINQLLEQEAKTDEMRNHLVKELEHLNNKVKQIKDDRKEEVYYYDAASKFSKFFTCIAVIGGVLYFTLKK